MTVGNFTGGRHGVGYTQGRKNFYCRDCAAFTSVPEIADDPRECATPGCTRRNGFGRYTGMPRPGTPEDQLPWFHRNPRAIR